MKNQLQKLTKEQLLELVEHFEHYPSVTEEDDKAYILTYLEDEACQISEEQILKYLLNIIIVEITKDNIHLYYEFMSDEDLERNEKVIYHKLMNRASLVQLPLSITPKDLQKNAEYKNSILTIFGIKDTLKPIDEYIEEIKESEKYKISTSECRCNNCMTYFESDEDLERFEDEDGLFLGCPDCKTDVYLMDLEDLK